MWPFKSKKKTDSQTGDDKTPVRSTSSGDHVDALPFDLPEKYNASQILFDNLDKGNAEKIAIYSERGNLTYGALCAQASQIANGLIALGLERGTRVLLFLDDSPAYPAAVFGAIRAGFVPLLINTLSTRELITYYLSDSSAPVAIIDGKYAEEFGPDVIGSTELKTIIAVNDPFNAEKAEQITLLDENWLGTHETTTPVADTGPDDMAFWMYSSGSTGRPKGVVHAQKDMAYTVISYSDHLLKLNENDICYSVPKMFFAYGFGNSASFPFAAGAAVILSEGRPVPTKIFDTVNRFKPTVFFGLPTLYTALMNADDIEKADFSSVRHFISAAETLAADIFNGWKQRFNKEIIEGLGSTEALHIYLSNTAQVQKLGSAGKRVPGYEIKLTNQEGEIVAPDEEGIMWVRGASNAPYYWNRPEDTQKTMRDGWIWTGDRFLEDEDGYFFFRGRADDLIKVSGQWVYPLEIELTLAAHDKIKECAVMGVPMEDKRMTLKAYVVLKDGLAGDEAMTKELQAYAKDKLVPYKYPREIFYLEELPKTGTDKINRQALLQIS